MIHFLRKNKKDAASKGKQYEITFDQVTEKSAVCPYLYRLCTSQPGHTQTAVMCYRNQDNTYSTHEYNRTDHNKMQQDDPAIRSMWCNLHYINRECDERVERHQISLTSQRTQQV